MLREPTVPTGDTGCRSSAGVKTALVRRPDFAELETFLVAARTGSLARAGEELLVSKTAVAKRISGLEALLGCRLLARGPRGVTLTDAGRQFVPRVEQVLAEADRAFETIDARRVADDSLRIAGARSLTGARAASTERVLAETERLFAEVFHQVADGIVIASVEDWRILEVNDAYCRIVGYAREELVGHNPVELGILTGTDLEDMRARVIGGEALAEHEIAITTKTGDQRTLVVTARPVTLGGAERALINVRDVTDRVVRQQLLRTRAAEQKALAELGLRALTHAAAADLIDQAVHVVSDALGVEIAAVEELLADGNVLVRSAVGLGDHPTGVVLGSGGRASQAGYTLSSAQPVISVDLRAERRFTPAPVLVAHGARSSGSVVIGTPERPWGVLIAASTRVRNFTEDDVVFFDAVAHLLGIARQREAAERELRRLGVAVEQGDDAIVVLELDARIASWNRGAERLFGYSPDEAVGQRLALLMPAEHSGEELELLARAAAGELARVQTTRARKDGHLVSVAITVSPIREVDGAVSAVLMIARDITHLKRAEPELSRLAAAAGLATDAIISTDREGVVRQWNHGATRLYGFSPDRAVGRHLRELTVNVEEFIANIKTVLETSDRAAQHRTGSDQRDRQAETATEPADAVADQPRGIGARDSRHGDAIAEVAAQAFTVALRVGNPHAAAAVIDRAPASGLSAVEIQSRVIAPAMWRIGELWERGDLTVAQEHLATDVSHHALTRLHPGLLGQKKHRGETVVVAAVEGEHHVLGLRMAADVFEGAGFEVRFLGADVPLASLLAWVAEHRPAIVALGVTMPLNAATLFRQLQALRDRDSRQQLVVGGQGVPIVLRASAGAFYAADTEQLADYAGNAPNAAVQGQLMADLPSGGVGFGPFVDRLPAPSAELEARFAQTTAATADAARRHARRSVTLEQIAIRDPLTELWPRRAFEDRCQTLSDDPITHPTTIMMIDVDHLKSINDHLGHDAGDRVLAGVARCITHALRPTDFAARYGGDEFAVLLPDTPLELAADIAERIRSQVEHEFTDPQLTVSIGISNCHHADRRRVTLDVDRALYDAKAHGRNHVASA